MITLTTTTQIMQLNINCSDREKKKQNIKTKKEAFKNKVLENRKVSLGNAIKGLDNFVKHEVVETRALFNDHLEFFQDANKDKNMKQNKTNNVTVDVEILDEDFFE